MREKFRRYASLDEADAHVRRVREVGIFANEGEEIEKISSDPKDDYLVALTRKAEVDYLVSGDPHLLDIADDVLPVVSPRTFLATLERALGSES